MLKRAQRIAKPSGAARAAAVAGVPAETLAPLLERCAGLEPWIRKIQTDLTVVPAPTGLEGLRAEWMLRAFTDLGLEATIDAAGNVIAARGAPEARTPRQAIAVTAHLDTVFPPGTPIVPVWRDGRCSAPGIADNGAGLAALLALARLLAESQLELPRPLLLVANVGEEGEGDLRGMRYLFERSRWREAIGWTLVLDGAGADSISNQALASQRWRVVFRGPGGHSWSDAGRASALHAAVRAAALVLAQTGNQPGVQACNLGWMQGGGAVNSIAAEAAFKIDLRARESGAMDEMLGALRRAIAAGLESENRAALSGAVEARLESIGSRPGGELAADAELMRVIHAADAALGIRTQYSCASTDANVPLALGREAVRLGAGGHGGGAHTLQEWFEPEGRELALRRLLLIVLGLAHRTAAAPALVAWPAPRPPRGQGKRRRG